MNKRYPLALNVLFGQVARLKKEREQAIGKLGIKREIIMKEIPNQNTKRSSAMVVLLPAVRAVIIAFIEF